MEIKFIAAICVLSAALCTGCHRNGRVYGHNPNVRPNNQVTAQQPAAVQKPAAPSLPQDLTTIYALKLKKGIVKRPNGMLDSREHNLTWVVEHNGDIVLEANAVDNFEMDARWHGNGHYKIWLKAWINGYTAVSNTVEFDMPLDGTEEPDDGEIDLQPIENTKYINAYKLTEDAGLVTRTSGEYESSNIGWKIVYNGVTKLERNAENEMSYRPMNYGDGKYEVWLEAFIDGGYKRVSNKVSWETPLDISAEDAEMIEMKSKMKSLIRNIDGENDHYEYKMGFVIDPDHDGEYNNCVFYAGTDNNGREAQYIFQNGTYSIQFSTNYTRDNGTAYMDNAYLYIWCDEITGKDYIVRCATDESGNITAKDCCTNEIIYTIINGELTLFGQKTQDKSVLDKGKYYFRSSAPYDKDHFIVSKNGKAEMQGA